MTINYIHTATRGAHFLIPDDWFLRLQFCEWLRHQHTTDELLLHNILWTDETCSACEDVFDINNSHVWEQDILNAICECGCQVHFSVSVLAGIVGDTVVGPYLLHY
jgi:hypothetical protein